MLRVTSIAIVLIFLIAGSSVAQEWREFVSKQDLFGCSFPGEPEVREMIWESEYGAQLPARVYTVKLAPSTYSITVVDYRKAEPLLKERAKKCAPGQERCDGLTAYSGEGYWKNDVRGAMIYASFKFMQRDIKLTHYMWNYLGAGPEVHELQFINNADKSRTFATIYMHHNRLYVMEATVPGHYPAPGIFTQSISLFEEDGSRANHDRVVFNGAELDPNETFVGRERTGQPIPPRQR